ncbi:hypothetical protein BZA77DRAFT_345702 [Pyronema omphalodes]|nr:hypothetical protein BZA77DRAFT_345702 [Pyronema omphalodes]
MRFTNRPNYVDLSSLSPTYYIPISTSSSSTEINGTNGTTKATEINGTTETNGTNGAAPTTAGDPNNQPIESIRTTQTDKVRHHLQRCQAPQVSSPYDARFFLIATTSKSQLTEELGKLGIKQLNGQGGTATNDRRFYERIRVVGLNWFWDSYEKGCMLNMRAYTLWEGRVEMDPDFPNLGLQNSQEHQALEKESKDTGEKMEVDPKESAKPEEGGVVVIDLDEDIDMQQLKPAQQEKTPDEKKSNGMNKILEDIETAKRKQQMEQAIRRLALEKKRLNDEEASKKLITKILEDERFVNARNALKRIKGGKVYEANKRISDWQYNRYSCCWPTPAQTKNDFFVSDLAEVKRMLKFRRSFSDANDIADVIAAIRAYPYEISKAEEILGLPFCNKRIANLWQGWHESSPEPSKRKSGLVRSSENDLPFISAKLFWKILGISEDRGTNFARNQQIFTLDEIRERYWDKLGRVAKLGLQHYDDLNTPIPRWEVKDIAKIITDAAKKHVPQIQARIVGPYRRGLTTINEVELLLSYPQTPTTNNLDHTVLLRDILKTLKSTPNLTLHILGVNNPLFSPPVSAYQSPSHDPDESLDKAYLLWKLNSGKYRRVTILFVPPASAGTALIYYTGDATWIRHLVAYCTDAFEVDFLADGVYRDGFVLENLDLGWLAGETWEACEGRVLETLEVMWRAPELRCTE